jgi:hypothetical protein
MKTDWSWKAYLLVNVGHVNRSADTVFPMRSTSSVAGSPFPKVVAIPIFLFDVTAVKVIDKRIQYLLKIIS